MAEESALTKWNRWMVWILSEQQSSEAEINRRVVQGDETYLCNADCGGFVETAFMVARVMARVVARVEREQGIVFDMF